MNPRPFLSCVLSVLFLSAVSLEAQVKLTEDSIDEVLSSMTLRQKAQICVGVGDFWGGDSSCRTLRDIPGAPGGTADFPEFGIPGLYVGDGPLGLRINQDRAYDSHKYSTTAYPVPLLVGSSWDTDLAYRAASDIGEECREYGIDILLGPSFNIIRNPLCGRTHEYYSEDPLLSGKMASAFARGVQSTGVGASMKHFAANNQETNRSGNNAVVSQRALREIYLKGFEIAIKEAEPWTVMTSYNLLNGKYTSENKELLEDVLRNEWGFQGLVMTDWGGGRHRDMQISAGNDLIQPGGPSVVQAIVDAVEAGTLSEESLDHSARRMLELVVKSHSFNGYKFSNSPDLEAHRKMVRLLGAESAVLLKNDGHTLPFTDEIRNVQIYGKTGYNVIPGGIGPMEYNVGNYTVSLVEGFRKGGFNISLDATKAHPESTISVESIMRARFRGETVPEDPEDNPSDEELAAHAAANDVAVVVFGHLSGEGNDRSLKDFEMRDEERLLLQRVASAYHSLSKKVVVILNIPGPVEMESWKDVPDAILCVYQGGEQIGNWIVDLLKGDITPSGKLTVTFAKSAMDYPSSRNFPFEGSNFAITGLTGAGGKVDNVTIRNQGPRKNIDYTLYEEGIYVGYRYFETFGIDVSYPFGYGLSYTDFEYSNPRIEKTGEGFSVRVDIRNTGHYEGKEIVQLYVSAPGGGLDKPSKELKSFVKTRTLKPGESQTVRMDVPLDLLSSFNLAKSRWETAKGSYKFIVGASIKDDRAVLEGKVEKPVYRNVHDVLKPDMELSEIRNQK